MELPSDGHYFECRSMAIGNGDMQPKRLTTDKITAPISIPPIRLIRMLFRMSNSQPSGDALRNCGLPRPKGRPANNLAMGHKLAIRIDIILITGKTAATITRKEARPVSNH